MLYAETYTYLAILYCMTCPVLFEYMAAFRMDTFGVVSRISRLRPWLAGSGMRWLTPKVLRNMYACRVLDKPLSEFNKPKDFSRLYVSRAFA